MLKRLVAQSDVVAPFTRALVGDEIAAGRLVALPAPPDWLHLEYGIIQPANAKLSPLAEALVHHLKIEDRRVAQLD